MPDDEDDPEEERDDPRASGPTLTPIRPWRIQPPTPACPAEGETLCELT